jgi:pimeloyl-ACP methyl ester carboxylesterase
MTRRAAQPCWIDAPAGPIFAWHHAPAGEDRSAAVVVCKPFGYEAACSHRAHRHLAERLAESGFHVLRLDYHGAGDSSGGDGDADRVVAWQDSVQAGIAWLEIHTGAKNIVLFGTRFGALMALAVSGVRAVDALVLFAPPGSGRVWLREMRAFQSMRNSGRTVRPPIAEGAEETVGFLLTRSTVEAMTQLDPLSSVQARHVLLMARDDIPGGEDRMAAKLESRGAKVTLSRPAGYSTMMQDDPYKSVVPEPAWSEASEWLRALYPVSPVPSVIAAAPYPPAYPRTAIVRETRDGPAVQEEAVDFGGLVAIITEPIDTRDADGLPAVILHNVGANPRVGCNRMYVTLARRWAAVGFRVLRLDSSGLGDSPAIAGLPENQVYSDQGIRDSGRAMDFLADTRKVDRFVLMGLCSGAYVSFHSGVAHERVAGIVLMNILLFHWKEGDSLEIRTRNTVKATSYYTQAVRDREVWRRVFRGDVHVRAIASALIRRTYGRVVASAKRVLSRESDVARGFRALLRRRTEVLLVFASDDGGRDVIDEHLGVDAKRFRGERGFRFEIIDGADHTFSSLAAQQELYVLLTSHLTNRFATAGRPRERPRETVTRASP